MKKKSILRSVVALFLAGSMMMMCAACSGSNDSGGAASVEANAGGETAGGDDKTIKVGASPAPHSEILEAIKPVLEEQGYSLEIIQFTDYIQPNVATTDGQILANYFQHVPYLDDYNAENGTELVSVGNIHFEPLGIFPGKTTSLDALADGAKVAVPNDPTNEARALQLLAAQGLLTLTDGVGLKATKRDILDNPKNLDIVEMEAAQLPRSLEDVDMAVINGNYALAAGLNSSTDALATEENSSEAGQTFPNALVVNKGNENDPRVQALLAAMTSDAARDFMAEKYQGAVVPVF